MGVHSFEADLNTRIGGLIGSGLDYKDGRRAGRRGEWGGSSLGRGLDLAKMGAPGGRRGCWGGRGAH